MWLLKSSSTYNHNQAEARRQELGFDEEDEANNTGSGSSGSGSSGGAGTPAKMEDDPLLRALLDPAALSLARETAAAKGLIKGRSASALGGFARAMLGLAATACVGGVPALLDAVLVGEDVDLMGAVVAPPGAPAPIAKLARQRQRRLEEMREKARAEFGEGPAWGGALGRYVEEAALMASDDEEEEALEEAEAATKVLKLMTVHKAKGLEFDAVFVAGLETRKSSDGWMGGWRF